MAIKKSELYATLWKSCDELRGGMDASQYKDYVLTFLFIKYVSDKYGDRNDAVVSVPSGGSFSDMIKLKGKPDIGDQINKIIARLAEENDLKGIIDLTLDAAKDEVPIRMEKANVPKFDHPLATWQAETVSAKGTLSKKTAFGKTHYYVTTFRCLNSGENYNYPL